MNHSLVRGAGNGGGNSNRIFALTRSMQQSRSSDRQQREKGDARKQAKRMMMVGKGVWLWRLLHVLMLLTNLAVLLAHVCGMGSNDESSTQTGRSTVGCEQTSTMKFRTHGFPGNKEREREMQDSELQKFVESAIAKYKRGEIPYWNYDVEEEEGYAWHERGTFGSKYHALLVVCDETVARPERSYQSLIERERDVLEDLRKWTSQGIGGEEETAVSIALDASQKDHCLLQNQKERVLENLRHVVTYMREEHIGGTMWEIIGDVEAMHKSEEHGGATRDGEDIKTVQVTSIGLYITEGSSISLDSGIIESQSGGSDIEQQQQQEGEVMLLLTEDELVVLFVNVKMVVRSMLRGEAAVKSLRDAEWEACKEVRELGMRVLCVKVEGRSSWVVDVTVDGPLLRLLYIQVMNLVESAAVQMYAKQVPMYTHFGVHFPRDTVRVSIHISLS